MNIKKKTLLEIEDFVLSEAQDKKTKYGLKQEIKYCSNCLMSNQRPNMCAEHYHTADKQKDFIKFEDDICDACKLVKKKKPRYRLERKRV